MAQLLNPFSWAKKCNDQEQKQSESFSKEMRTNFSQEMHRIDQDIREFDTSKQEEGKVIEVMEDSLSTGRVER